MEGDDTMATWRPVEAAARARWITAVMLAAVLASLPGCDAGNSAEAEPLEPVDVQQVEVLDGDSIKLGDGEVRIVGYDAPEMSAPWFEGDQEPWATRAARALEAALGRADRVTMREVAPEDKYGRTLAQIYVDGVPVGVELLEKGLAYETVTRYGHNGLEADAERLLKAAERSGEPPFLEPHSWRRTHSTEVRED
jgi:endonuclease YncB( thermonuclease family)